MEFTTYYSEVHPSVQDMESTAYYSEAQPSVQDMEFTTYYSEAQPSVQDMESIDIINTIRARLVMSIREGHIKDKVYEDIKVLYEILIERMTPEEDCIISLKAELLVNILDCYEKYIRNGGNKYLFLTNSQYSNSIRRSLAVLLY